MKIRNHKGVEAETRVVVEEPHPASIHHVPTDVAEFHEQQRQLGVRQGHVLHRGDHHPVNDHWHEANTVRWPWLAGTSRHELRATQDELLEKSNHVRLTKDELEYLRAANNHFDVRTCIDHLGGRHHSEFGFEGVDQIHGNVTTYPCGCQLQTVYDHHGRGQVDNPHHPHHPLVVCAAHMQHAHDIHRLHKHVHEDNQPAEPEV